VAIHLGRNLGFLHKCVCIKVYKHMLYITPVH
jgi:hypothetical protein